MRGILWRWLFFFGALLWVSLCLADYHKKYLKTNLKQTLEKNIEIRIDPPAPPIYQIVPQPRKLHPPRPALTFWKFLSIVFSVSAIVIIKRLSTFRKKSLPNNSCSDFDLIRPPYSTFISKVPPTNNTYNSLLQHQEFQVSRLEANFSAGDSKPTTIVGVKIVQKKLEDLENNIATLKQRINSNSTSNPASASSDSIKRACEQNLASNQNYFEPNTPDTTPSTVSSTQTSEIKTRKEILLNHTRPVTPNFTSVIQNFPKDILDKTPEKFSRNSGRSSASELKLVQNDSDFEKDVTSLKELRDSMLKKSSCYGTGPFGLINFEETYVNKEDPLLKSLSSFNLSSKHCSKENSSRNSLKQTKSQTSDSKTISDSKTNSTCPSISSRKSHEGSSKSFLRDENSSTKTLTDWNLSTSTLTSIKKKRHVKQMKNRNKDSKSLIPISTTIALPASFHSTSFPRSRHSSSYAAINRKRVQTLKELRSNTRKNSAFDQISVSSSNDSTDSIDKFVAKILKPDSEGALMKHSSDELSMASTSISSLTASSTYEYISGAAPKLDSITSSIRSILPVSHTTISSHFSSPRSSRNMPAGAEPLSSGESIVEKNTSKYRTKVAIHSLAMDYLQTLQEKTLASSESRDKVRDSGSEFSCTTKSVMDKYRTLTTDSSVASSHKNILDDKYWLLHW